MLIKTNHAIRWIVLYPGDRVIHLLNNQGQPSKLRLKPVLANDNLDLVSPRPSESRPYDKREYSILFPLNFVIS